MLVVFGYRFSSDREPANTPVAPVSGKREVRKNPAAVEKFVDRSGCGADVARPLVAGWSSLVARQAHNLKVVGSNPTPAPNLTPSWT
jgi:hypothetical protein